MFAVGTGTSGGALVMGLPDAAGGLDLLARHVLRGESDQHNAQGLQSLLALDFSEEPIVAGRFAVQVQECRFRRH